MTTGTISIFYATREGHTKKIAEYLTEVLKQNGCHAVMRDVREQDSSGGLAHCPVAIFAASVHAGKHEREMLRFIRNHRAELESIYTVFLSVSLSQAGAERTDAPVEQHQQFVQDVQFLLQRFLQEARWRPNVVMPVAGALPYSRYNWVIRSIMRRIAEKAGAETDTSRDYEYTNWHALEQLAAELAHRLEP